MSRRPTLRGALAVLLPTVLLVAAPASARPARAQAVAPATRSERDGQLAVDRAIRQELEAVNAAMTAAFNRGDYLAAARFYTDDAQIIGEGVRVTGRAAIDRYWTSIPPGATWKLDVLDAGGGHASPWQLGRSTLVMPSRDGGGATNTSIVDFVGIYRRQPDRSLKLYIDIYVVAPRASAPR
jgi:ketosteroid isomerase-like protein